VAVSQEESIKRRLRAVPDAPGVYLFRDSKTQVIYVGKALRLRDRLRQYFTTGYGETARVSELVRKIYDFEFVTTANEVEALVLECNLIKNYRPRFNIRLKDDKNYLYLKLPVKEEFPRVHYSRRVQNDGSLYFGPYTSAQSLRGTVKSIRQLLPFRTCSDDIFKQGKVCLDFHIKRCPGPCERRISAEDYKARIHEVGLFMEGRSDVLVRELHERMEGAADKLDFENAARYRDQLQSIEKIADRQNVITRSRDDQDLIAYARRGNEVYVEVAYVRQGKMVGHDGHPLDGAGEASEAELLRGFVLQYYASATHVPRTVILPGPLDEMELMTGWLSQRRGGPVTIEVPQRGRKRALVTQLAETAAQELEQLRIQADYDKSRTEPMLAALAEALDLETPPKRIECYDISNIQGDSAVGAMVVFEDGRPRNDHYRHFRIKFVPGPNDFAMLQEVLRRRLERLESAQRREEADIVGDRSFTSRPDPDPHRRWQGTAERGARGAGVGRLCGHPDFRAGQGARGDLCSWTRRADRPGEELARDVPRAEDSRRGAPLRDHAPPQGAVQEGAHFAAGLGRGHRTHAQARPPATLRFRAGDTRGPGRGHRGAGRS